MGVSLLLLTAIWLVMVAYVMFLAFYRLYFHPLSKFPGPFLAALTDYWELYQDFFREESGYLFIELDNLHKKYGTHLQDLKLCSKRSNKPSTGPIIRIRPNEVHIKDSKWMDVLYTGPSDVGADYRPGLNAILIPIYYSLAIAIH